MTVGEGRRKGKSSPYPLKGSAFPLECLPEPGYRSGVLVAVQGPRAYRGSTLHTSLDFAIHPSEWPHAL